MRFRPFQLARLFGIPVMIDYTWPPVVVLHIWLVSAFYLPNQLWLLYGVQLPVWLNLAFGVVMTALLFASVLAHELSHALMARLEGIEIHDIQLHIFGGWARLASEPRTPFAELRVAIAGPASSFLLAMLFAACRLLVQAIAPQYMLRAPLQETFRYLFLGNLILAVFNLLPGLPLDGGRALRAWLWHRRKDILAATQMAKRMGVAIAYMMISYGFYRLIWWRDFLSAVWLVVIGFFLKNAAESDYRYRQQQRAHEQAGARAHTPWDVQGTVGAVMSAPAVSVPPELRISEFIDQILAVHRHTSFPVARDGRLHGMISLEKLRAVPREEWERLAIHDVMQPVDETLFVPVRASLEYAAQKLKASPYRHLAVVDGDGLLVGYLSPGDLERAA
jgi:Zn-dependent protease/CBS domain-containing protein